MRIQLEQLSVRHGAHPAVMDASLTIATGQWTGLIGANGSGKTSLLRAVAGRGTLHCGRVVVDGIDRTGDRAWRARAIGFAAEASTLPPTLTGRELFAIIASDSPGRAADDPLADLRAALDFDRFIDRRIGTLSAGMRQRLAIFTAFLTRPAAVFLDEPFNWLDPVCAFDTKAALGALVDAKAITLLTALHETATLVHHCGSGILLSGGRISRLIGEAELEAGRRDYSRFEADIVRSLRSAPRN